MKIKKLFIVLLLVGLINEVVFNGLCYSNGFQADKLIIAVDSSTTCENITNSLDLMILYQPRNTNDYYEILRIPCKTQISDLQYSMYYETKKGKFSVFMEYSSPAGLTKYFYFDIENKRMFSTEFFEEIHIPLLTSANIKKGGIQFLSLDNKECGQILTSPLKLIWEFSVSLKKTRDKFKIIETVINGK